jgi:hypothetical protein
VVLAYDDLASLPPLSSVLVDFAGNAGLMHGVHTALADHLKYSCTVGATHVGAGFGQNNGPLPGPTPILFFAPDHAVAAIKEQGPKAFGEAVGESWLRFIAEAGGALTIDERHGLEAARQAYLATLAGKADPAVGIVIRP